MLIPSDGLVVMSGQQILDQEFYGKHPKKLIIYLQSQGYAHFRDVPNVGLCCLAPFIFTVGVVVNPTFDTYAHRYCFKYFSDALIALIEWDGEGDLPGNWIKKKGWGVDEENPNYVDDPR